MTRQQEAKADTGQPDLEDLKYLRVGYTDQGRKSDLLLKQFLTKMPGNGRMPTHWQYRSLAHFQKKYSQLGMIVWAATTNSHLLLINGQQVLRIWTDTEHSCYVDINDTVNSQMIQLHWGTAEVIPANNAKKSKPFKLRRKIHEQYQMLHLVEAVKRAYGLDK